jgi:hypothetical protein
MWVVYAKSLLKVFSSVRERLPDDDRTPDPWLERSPAEITLLTLRTGGINTCSFATADRLMGCIP